MHVCETWVAVKIPLRESRTRNNMEKAILPGNGGLSLRREEADGNGYDLFQREGHIVQER